MPPAEQPACVAPLNAIRNSKLANVRFLPPSLALFFAGAVATSAFAGVTTGLDNPYKVIYARNLFRLRPPVSATAAAPKPTLPASTIILTGITTILGSKRAFLEITPPPKPPQPAKAISCVLTEGQREAGVEVLQIDPKTEFVKVSNNGTPMTLTFDKNGRKLTTPPPPPQRTIPRLPIRFPLRSPFRKY